MNENTIFESPDMPQTEASISPELLLVPGTGILTVRMDAMYAGQQAETLNNLARQFELRSPTARLCQTQRKRGTGNEQCC